MTELLRLVAVCVLMILLLRRNLNLGVVMILASVAFGIAFGFGPVRLMALAARSAIAPDTLNLIAALVLIAFLEKAMGNAGLLQRMVGALRGLVPDRRVIMALLPAFLGFLPSAGGARFSAPLVGQVTADLEVSPERKAFINYWYRHIWECIMPIYPSIILTGQVLGVPLDRLIVAMAPMPLIMVAAGLVPAFRGMEQEMRAEAAVEAPGGGDGDVGVAVAAPEHTGRRSYLLDAAVALSPVVAILIGVVGLGLSIAAAVGCVLAAMIILGRYSWRDMVRLVREGFSLNVVFLVLGVMFFREVVEASGALDEIFPYLVGSGVPPMLLLFILPFLVGFSTGLGIAVPGVAFPLISGLFRASGGVNLSLVGFAFVGGFVGTMLSPAHLCLVLSVDYFKADFGRVHNALWMPGVVVLAGALALALLRNGI